MERPWLVFIVHLFIYSTNNYWGLTFSMLSEAGTCSQEQNAVGGGRSGLVCPGKASPRRRRVGHAEIWLRTCQAEESAKMLKRKQAWRVWGPAEARVDAGRVREKTGVRALRGLLDRYKDVGFTLSWELSEEFEPRNRMACLGSNMPLCQFMENRMNGYKGGAHCNNPDQRWRRPGPEWYPKRWWEVAKSHFANIGY